MEELMSEPEPIRSGLDLESERQSNRPGPKLPEKWTATSLLSPFGDSISPLKHCSQLVVGAIECCWGRTESWMRANLYLTQDETYFDFVFLNIRDKNGQLTRQRWYWIDSDPKGEVKTIYGPFETTLQIPGPESLDKAQWGNAYPLMCTDTRPDGIDCYHWVVPSPGSTDHGSWCTFRKDTGNLFRIFMMDSTNPLSVPILGSFFITNLPTFTANEISEATTLLITSIREGATTERNDYWNPMVTQEDIHRAMAFPIVSRTCTTHDIQAVIPGFRALPSGVKLPCWSNKTYIEGWTLGTDFIPYYTQVRYLWTNDANSKQQTVFVGLGTVPGKGVYTVRTDTCLDATGAAQPYYEWQVSTNSWKFYKCLDSLPGVGPPQPDWVERDNGVVMGQILGNQNFGLGPNQTLNLIAAQLPRGRGEMAIFWLWFLENGSGMLFSEGNYMNSLSHNLQIIDYRKFIQNAALTELDFDNPCAATTKAVANVKLNYAHVPVIPIRTRVRIA
jgi:hypothetical protein